MKKIFFVIAVITTTIQLHAQSIRGIVIDKETKDPLSFATVGIEGSSFGTISNENGVFEFSLPEQLKDSPIQVSYLGYRSKTISAAEYRSSSQLIIGLEPSILTLDELVIRPLSPEDYIKRVLRNMESVMSKQPAASTSLYREVFRENGQYLAFTEGIWKTYHRAYVDTLANQYQLVLYETAEDPAELQFMKESRDKKDARKKKKAEKKGEEYDDESADLISASFSGPSDILEMDLTNQLDDFLDSAYFKKFRYSFGTPVAFRNRELLVIDFESKGTVDHLRSKGKIYIDTKTDAFASIIFDAEAVIPVVIRPILFSLGISIDNPVVRKELRYQLVGDSWYPEYFHIDVNLDITKRHLFSANENSKFYIEQLLKLSELDTENPTEIKPEYRYDLKKDPAEQVFNEENLKWEDFNRLSSEGS